MVESEALLKLQSISRRFGNFEAVKSISFEVRRGEIFALLGPNGAGKTTTMRIAIGILQANSGQAEIAGHECFQQRHRCMAITGYVPDEPCFPSYIRGSELIRFQGEMHGLEVGEAEDQAAPLIQRLELGDAIEDFAVNYSKGMKKKLAVVLALVHQPKLLILDELTNGLDPYATRELHQLMLEQCAQGCAILFSTHLLDQAQRLCNRLAIINKGKIAIMGTLSELGASGDKGEALEQLFFRHTGNPAEQGPAEDNTE